MVKKGEFYNMSYIIFFLLPWVSIILSMTCIVLCILFHGYSLEKAQVVGTVGIVGMVGIVGIVGINKQTDS